MTTIFISHSGEDNDIAREFSRQLEEAGVSIWLDEKQLVPGDSIAGEISRAIDVADAVLILLSDASTKSRWLLSEIAVALAHGKKVIPVVLDPKAEVPLLLRDRKHLDYYRQPDVGIAVKKILQSLSRPLDEEEALTFRTERLQEEREQLIREQQQLALLKERREVEIRSMTFSVVFVFIFSAAAFLFYFLERRPGEFNFLWLALGILVGAAAVELGHYFRSRIQIKSFDREARR